MLGLDGLKHVMQRRAGPSQVPVQPPTHGRHGNKDGAYGKQQQPEKDLHQHRVSIPEQQAAGPRKNA